MLTMKKITTSILLVALTSALCSVQAGEVTGKITLKGTPPQEKTITPLKEDPTCGKFHPAVPTTKFYVVGAGGELADVVVSLEGVSGKSKGASAAPAVLDQKSCLYVPQIMAVQTGQKITVKNSDPVMHNVHSQPATKGNKEDNKVQMPNGADLTFSYDQPEDFVKFKCDVHPWMFAWVSVFDHPYFAVTKADGTFKISDVPAGKYKLKLNHRKAGTITQDIEVKDDAPATVTLALDAK